MYYVYIYLYVLGVLCKDKSEIGGTEKLYVEFSQVFKRFHLIFINSRKKIVTFLFA